MDKSNINNMAINIFQWNAQSLKPKLVSFGELLNREKIHVAILSETWLDALVDINISGYNIFRRDRYDGYGGVAIITHKSIRCHVGRIAINNSGIEVIHVRVNNCNLLENIVSVYCPSSVRTQSRDWDKLFELFPHKSLIAGDFNGHHSNWSCKSDVRGEQLADSALDNGFIPLNNGAATRIKLVNGNLQQTSPDVTFVSSDIAVKFDWHVFNENLGSDHLIIKLKLTIPNNALLVKKRNFKRLIGKHLQIIF